MNAIGPRRDTRAKHQEAARLRGCGYTWQAIADSLGYRSRQGAKSAVERLYARERELPETSRRALVDGLLIVKTQLFEGLAAAKQRRDFPVVAMLTREIRQTTDQLAKLDGLHAAQKVDVTVTQTQTQLINELERRLLDVAGVVDAEVIDVREISQ